MKPILWAKLVALTERQNKPKRTLMHTVPIDLTLNKSNQTKKNWFPYLLQSFHSWRKEITSFTLTWRSVLGCWRCCVWSKHDVEIDLFGSSNKWFSSNMVANLSDARNGVRCICVWLLCWSSHSHDINWLVVWLIGVPMKKWKKLYKSRCFRWAFSFLLPFRSFHILLDTTTIHS